MRCSVLAVALCLLAPATASARKAEDTFFNSVIPIRVDHLIGFTPTTFAIHPAGERVKPITVRSGGKTHRYIFGSAAAVVGPSAGIYMRNMIRQRRYPSPQGIFLDRRLTSSERRHVRVRDFHWCRNWTRIALRRAVSARHRRGRRVSGGEPRHAAVVRAV